MEKVYKIYSKLVLAGIIIGFSTQMYFVYLHFTHQRDKANQIAARISKQPW
jgi:multisubunit Na+/H+ antiporter MnhC subunit